MKCVSILSVASLSLCQASLLRGLNPLKVEGTPSSNTTNAVNTFDCQIYELDGIAPPGSELKSEWTCEFEPTDDSSTGQVYSFSGDIESILKARFDVDIKVNGGLKITVPWEAVDGTTIIGDHEGISVDETQHERNLIVSQAPLRGNTNVLIVRVRDKRGNAPTWSKAQLYNDFFEDDNNLVSSFSIYSVHHTIILIIC